MVLPAKQSLQRQLAIVNFNKCSVIFIGAATAAATTIAICTTISYFTSFFFFFKFHCVCAMIREARNFTKENMSSCHGWLSVAATKTHTQQSFLMTIRNSNLWLCEKHKLWFGWKKSVISTWFVTHICGVLLRLKWISAVASYKL